MFLSFLLLFLETVNSNYTPIYRRVTYAIWDSGRGRTAALPPPVPPEKIEVGQRVNKSWAKRWRENKILNFSP
jgi:hypothetical protein